MPEIIMGIFALLIAAVSLFRLMAETEFYRLTMIKRVFGRKRGLAIHFIVTVALPVTVGIIFLTGGVTGKTITDPLQASDLPVLDFQFKKQTVPFHEDWLVDPDIIV